MIFFDSYDAEISYRRNCLNIIVHNQNISLPILPRRQKEARNVLPENNIFNINVPEIYSGPITMQPTEMYLLKPAQIQYIKFNCFPHPINRDCILEPKISLLYRTGLQVPAGIISPNNHVYPVINNSNETIKLHPGTSIGQIIDLPRELNLNSLKIDNALQIKSSNNKFEQKSCQNGSQINHASTVESNSKLSNDIEWNINPDLKPEQKNKVTALLNEFRAQFAKDPCEIRQANCVKARLQLKHPSKIINIRPFRTSPEETKNFNKHIQNLQAQNIVEDSYSIFNNPPFLAQKSDGSQRLLGDFRKLNENLVKVDSFLPRINTFLDNLRGSNFSLFAIFDRDTSRYP